MYLSQPLLLLLNAKRVPGNPCREPFVSGQRDNNSTKGGDSLDDDVGCPDREEEKKCGFSFSRWWGPRLFLLTKSACLPGIPCK